MSSYTGVEQIPIQVDGENEFENAGNSCLDAYNSFGYSGYPVSGLEKKAKYSVHNYPVALVTHRCSDNPEGERL